jgi:hypothetical protein
VGDIHHYEFFGFDQLYTETTQKKLIGPNWCAIRLNDNIRILIR